MISNQPRMESGNGAKLVTLQKNRPFDLRDTLARLTEVRAAGEECRLNGSCALPSRQVMLDVIDGLVAALFPCHFGPANLHGDDIECFVSGTLNTKLPALQDQVSLELELAQQDANRNRVPVGASGTAWEIVANLASALPEVRALLDTDIRAAYAGDPSAKSLDEVICCFPGVAAMIRHRIAHKLYKSGVTLLARMIAEFAHSQTGIDIHPGAQIGESFFIDHGTGVVIGETSIIGRHVRLYQAVTLGAKRFELDENGSLRKDYPRHPILEDDVVIYAGATVLGRVTIGKGSSIGGNVWLTQSVPPGSHLTQAKVQHESFDDGAGI
jgi:serine O-acetyltransferase